MKPVKIEIEIINRNDYIGGYDVLLKSKHGEVKAFINDKNYVTVPLGGWLHGLLKSAPYTSEFVQKAKEEIQLGFKDWDVTNKEIIVNYPFSNKDNYEEKRVQKRVSLNSETDSKILEYANRLEDFSNSVKNQLKSSMISEVIYKNINGLCIPNVALQKRLSLPPITFNSIVYLYGHGITHKTNEAIKSQKRIIATEALYNKLANDTYTGFTIDYIAIVFNNKIYAMTIQEAKKHNINDDTFYSCLCNHDFYDEYNGMLLNAVFGEKLNNKEMLKIYDEIIQKIKEI